MSSKFAKLVQDAQKELVEQVGQVQINPDEVEGIMRWASTADPTTFKQFDTMKGDQYVGSIVDAYRATQQQDPNAAQQPQATGTQPQATGTQPQATGTQPTAQQPNVNTVQPSQTV